MPDGDSTYSYLTGSLPHADWRRIVALFEGSALVAWAIDPATIHAIDIPFYIASIASFLLLLSPVMRDRLRKPVQLGKAGRLGRGAHG